MAEYRYGGNNCLECCMVASVALGVLWKPGSGLFVCPADALYSRLHHFEAKEGAGRIRTCGPEVRLATRSLDYRIQTGKEGFEPLTP